MVIGFSKRYTLSKAQRKLQRASSICKLSLKVNNNRKKTTRSEKRKITKKYRLIYRDSPQNTSQYLIDQYQKNPTAIFDDDDDITMGTVIPQGSMIDFDKGKLSLISQTDLCSQSTEYDDSTNQDSNLDFEPDIAILPACVSDCIN